MATVAKPTIPVAAERAGAGLLSGLPRALTIAVTACAVLAPLSLIVYQSLLSAPFFDAVKKVGVDFIRRYEAAYGENTMTQFSADAWGAYLLIARRLGAFEAL